MSDGGVIIQYSQVSTVEDDDIELPALPSSTLTSTTASSHTLLHPSHTLQHASSSSSSQHPQQKGEEDEVVQDEEEGGSLPGGIVHAIRNDNPFPISRPPSQYRDILYGLFFLIHFLAILFITLIEKTSLRHAVLNYGRAGSWASIVMSLILVSTVSGVIVFIVLKIGDARLALLTYSAIGSFLLKICLGNILLIVRSPFSFLGVFLLISAFLDSGRLRPAHRALGFTSTVIQLALDVNAVYGLTLSLACIGIVATQTCVLLWWGSFYIGVLSTVSPGWVAAMTLVMLFSLTWTTQIFHYLISFLVGGCTLYYFAKDENEILDRRERVRLYTVCALTTSFGSICKAALFSLPAQMCLHVQAWMLRSLSPASLCARCLTGFERWTGLMEWAARHSKLNVPLMAVYGRTMARTAEDLCTFNAETLRTAEEEFTSYSLGCLATSVAGVVAIIFGLLAEARSIYSWPLFFFLCFYLAYCAISLTLHIYASAVDAFIVAAATFPARFAKENQLVLLRFLRTGDPDLLPAF